MCYSRSYFPHFLPQTLKSQTYIYHVLKNSLGGLSLLVVPAWPGTWLTLSIMRSVQSLFSLTPRLTMPWKWKESNISPLAWPLDGLLKTCHEVLTLDNFTWRAHCFKGGEAQKGGITY